jgi:hypothetical protein
VVRAMDYLRFPQGARLCLGMLFASALFACSPSSPNLTLTVDYYRAHPAEREEALRRCSNDPGGVGQAPPCVNAREAARIEGLGSLRTLPPMGLPTPTNRAAGQPGSSPAQ